MIQVLRNIGHSEKLREALRGEKGVGILPFALLADELHLGSYTGDGIGARLVLKRSGFEASEGRSPGTLLDAPPGGTRGPPPT